MRKGVKPEDNIRLLSENDEREIHNHVLQIMENIGLKVKNDEVLNFLERNGCEVDYDEQRVRIPSYIVNDCIDKAPSQFRMGARDPENDIMFQQGRSYFCACTGPVTKIQPGEDLKKPTKEDQEEAGKISDALDNIDVTWVLYTLSEDPLLGLKELDSALNNTTKHIGLLNWYGRDLVGKQIEMLKEVAGGEEELRDRPLATLYVEPTSPLSMAEEHAEAILKWTDHDLPYLNFPIQFPGATSPASLAGSIAQGFAESFLGLVIGQLNNPGNPFIGGVWPFPMDLRQGESPYFAAEAMLIQAAAGQMAEFYEIPVYGTGGCSNSYYQDVQMGAEMALTMWGSFLGGETLIHDVGVEGAGDAGSPESLILGDELIGILKRQAEGINIDDESFALELIEDVGPEGEFVATKHTRDHMEDFYFPEFLKRVKMEDKREESDKAISRVRNKYNDIVNNYEPEPLDSDIKENLSQIIDEASDLA
ncbi:MAG: Trimethylamine:corrinoid methyltransferase, MttB2 [Candidatus Methanohalarchaeum thermophilum]|uniref:Trimethylamine:corrinoid methyltransferase, MttB2 n=1 Tax=Methanohalarchaeum thermophilum TaxID=1903181 RepID=A0A1Q6DUV6_METT1|nr:MAG: Trimethylamine:corrinoid methyltransferase, MttB2 [Candidatus Methanohalarchaeum thermophilum]